MHCRSLPRGRSRTVGIHVPRTPICSFVPSSSRASLVLTMGKSRKQKHSSSNLSPYNKSLKSKKNLKSTKSQSNSKSKQAHPASARSPQLPPTVPFSSTDRILLVGEGDFSFTHSLLSHHSCQSLIATCYDSATTLAEKYPQSADYIRDLEDAARDHELTELKALYGVDATKLGKGGLVGGGQLVRKGGFDRVIFNFPHVGGLTKDVNRQVRHNQGIDTIHPPGFAASNLRR